MMEPAGSSLLETIKPVVPIPLLLVLLPALWWFFRTTWKELDAEALEWRKNLDGIGKTDMRPVVALVMCAVILTLQEYYGGRIFYDQAIRPHLVKWDLAHPRF